MPPEPSPLEIVSGGHASVPPAEPAAHLGAALHTWRARRRLVSRARAEGMRVVDLPGRSTGRTWRNRLHAYLTRGAVAVDEGWPWEDLCAAAGLADAPDPGVGSGGGLWAKGTVAGSPVLLRAGRAEASPAPAATVLQQLAGQRCVPRLIGAGRWDGLDWTVEEALPGSMPERLTSALIEQCVQWLASLPVARRRGDIPVLPVGPIASEATARAQRAVNEAAEKAGELPPVFTHGDFWRGNLLAADGGLTGVIDWDAAATAGPPGTDLLQLLGVEERHRRRVSMGRVWLTRFWDAPQAEAWLRQLDHDLADPGLRLAVATVWWARSVANDVSRQPRLAADSHWWRENVSLVAEELDRLALGR